MLDSPRFYTISTSQKSAFFYDLLVKDLQGRVNDQKNVFESVQFRALPGSQQSRLMRVTAIEYLLKGEHIDIAKKWLQMAWARAPLDPKTGIVALLAVIRPEFAKVVIKTWQNNRRNDGLLSPVELALVSEKKSDG